MYILKSLQAITENTELHARFLNSLSYLEYRGFRKIASSQRTDQISLEVLQHASEEARHALFFKRQAIKMGGPHLDRFENDSLLAASALKNYFYAIDQHTAGLILSSPVAQQHSASQAVYHLVTWLVETRAMKIYQQYEELLRRVGFSFSLNGILREEHLHLDEMIQRSRETLTALKLDAETFVRFEETEFQKLWTAIECAIEAPL